MGWNVTMPDAEFYDHDSPRLAEIIQEVVAQPVIAIDTETTGLNVMKDIPLFWSLAWEGRRMCMPASTMHRFAPAFASPNKQWYLANAKYDMHMLAQVGHRIAGKVLDTQVMHALVYEEQPHGLKYMAKHLLNWGWRDFFDTFDPLQVALEMKEQNDSGTIKEIDPLDDEPPTRKRRAPTTREETIGEMLMRFYQENRTALVEYASNDAFGTYQIGEHLKKQLQEEATWSLYPDEYQNLWDIFWKTEVPFTKVLFKCERNGILIDVDYINSIKGPVEENLHQIEREIANITGRLINLKSRDELAHYFFDEKGYRATKMTKGGKTGVKKKALDADVLADLAGQHQDPVAKKVLEHRDLAKLNGTYIVGLAKHLDKNNRIHCRLNQDVARCMPAGELVLTSRGYLPVEQVIVSDHVITHTGKTRRVVERSTHTPQPIYCVRLSNGLELRTTGNHQYRVNDIWVRADALRLGDSITVHSEPEEWRTIPHWDEFEVSSWGRVRNIGTKRVRAQHAHGTWGHLKVTLTRNGAQARGEDNKDFKVHRLVLSAFGIGSGEVRHLNGIAWDNTIQNLRYGTSQENRNDIEGSYASFYEADVVTITLEAPEVTYGLTVEEDHSHVTGGIVTHNTGRLSSSNPNCFHPDTELLTPQGWVAIKDYLADTPVAQWASDGTITFVLPTAFITQHAETLIELTNQHIRLALTPDHRCLLRHRKTRELRVFSAEQYPEDWQQLHAGQYTGGTLQLGDDVVRLLVAIQADGHLHHGGVDFGFRSARKVKRLLDILGRLELSHSYNPSDARGVARIRLQAGAPLPNIITLLGPSKLFGPWLLELSDNEAEVFCEEVFFWDGSWTRKNSYSSDNYENAKWVQTLLALRGKRAHFREYTKANGGINYQVDIVHRDYSLTTNVLRQTLTHRGQVYCVSVPSTYVLVRYADEIAVTGQCQNIPTTENDRHKIRRAFIAGPGKKLIVYDYKALEMRLLASAAQAKDMIQIFLEGKDIHMGNAVLVFSDIYERKYGRSFTYEDLVQAKKIDGQVKDGALPESAKTEWMERLLFARLAIKSVAFG